MFVSCHSANSRPDVLINIEVKHIVMFVICATDERIFCWGKSFVGQKLVVVVVVVIVVMAT